MGVVSELDAVGMILCALTCKHAEASDRRSLVVMALLLGVVVEAFTGPLGLMRAHANDPFDTAAGALLGSGAILFYVPVCYTAVVAASKLTGEHSGTFPWLTGLLLLITRAPYELVGVPLGWWRWCAADEELDAGLSSPQVLLHRFAARSLQDRVYGVPVVTFLFTALLGLGIGWTLQSVRFRHVPVVAVMGPLCALLSVYCCLSLIELVSIPLSVAVANLLLCGLFLPLFTGPSFVSRPTKDVWLFAIPAAHSAYVKYKIVFAGSCASVLSPSMQFVVLVAGGAAMTLHAKASGVLETDDGEEDESGLGEAALSTALSWPPKSFLDSLQKNAQKSELDYTNTPATLFSLLALVQAPVCVVIARYVGLPDWLALFPIVSHAAGFLLAVTVIKSCKFFDIWGEVSFGSCVLLSLARIPAPLTPRQILATVLLLTWCTRLGLFLGWRIFQRGSDWRFDKLMNAPAYNLFGWVSQGTWVFLQGMCLWLLHAAPDIAQSQLGAVDAVGTLIFLTGLTIEHVADMQKTRWNAANRSGQQTTWIRTGLWRYSRHPNMFGENLLWLGIAIVCMRDVPPLLCMISPVWSVLFLVFTSLMLLEKRIDAKFGQFASYLAYKRGTSVLIPWPPLDLGIDELDFEFPLQEDDSDYVPDEEDEEEEEEEEDAGIDYYADLVPDSEEDGEGEENEEEEEDDDEEERAEAARLLGLRRSPRLRRR